MTVVRRRRFNVCTPGKDSTNTIAVKKGIMLVSDGELPQSTVSRWEDTQSFQACLASVQELQPSNDTICTPRCGSTGLGNWKLGSSNATGISSQSWLIRIQFLVEALPVNCIWAMNEQKIVTRELRVIRLFRSSSRKCCFKYSCLFNLGNTSTT